MMPAGLNSNTSARKGQHQLVGRTQQGNRQFLRDTQHQGTEYRANRTPDAAQHHRSERWNQKLPAHLGHHDGLHAQQHAANRGDRTHQQPQRQHQALGANAAGTGQIGTVGNGAQLAAKAGLVQQHKHHQQADQRDAGDHQIGGQHADAAEVPGAHQRHVEGALVMTGEERNQAANQKSQTDRRQHGRHHGASCQLSENQLVRARRHQRRHGGTGDRGSPQRHAQEHLAGHGRIRAEREKVAGGGVGETVHPHHQSHRKRGQCHHQAFDQSVDDQVCKIYPGHWLISFAAQKFRQAHTAGASPPSREKNQVRDTTSRRTSWPFSMM